MLAAPVVFSEQQAVEAFSRRPWYVRWRPPRKPRRVELLWFPHYYLTFDASTRRSPGTITASIEAWSGAFSVVSLDAPLEETAPAETVLPPLLTLAQAEEKARTEVQHAVLRLRSQGERPLPKSTLDTKLVHIPFWVYYFERRHGRMDIRVFDAAFGGEAGARTRAGVLHALVSHHPG